MSLSLQPQSYNTSDIYSWSANFEYGFKIAEFYYGTHSLGNVTAS